MPVKSEEILSTAEHLIESSPSEAEIRASISRSYYSMYHKVLSILANEPIQYPKKGVHSSLVQYLQTDAQHDEEYNFMSLKGLAYMLRQEKDCRVNADYYLNLILEEKNAIDSFITAKRCFQKCDELIDSCKKSAMV